MKTLMIAALSLLLMSSCKKDDDKNPDLGKGNIPVEARGQWLHGTFAMADYWGYDGSYQGNPFSQSVAFNFKSDGTYEFFYTGQSNYYGCTMDAYSYFKGYAVFNDSTFTVYPSSGRFRGYYNCQSYSNFDRKAEKSELKVTTYYYTYETDQAGKKWMIISESPIDQYSSYFSPTTW